MEIGEMITQNRSLMQLLLQNQCYLEIIVEDVAEKLKEDFADKQEQLVNMMEIRRTMAEKYYTECIGEVKKILAENPAGAVIPPEKN
jgi:hypothetical protein